MADNKDRVVLTFKEGDKFDNLLLAALEELCAKRDRGGKIKEGFRKYIEVNEPEVYKRALEKVENPVEGKKRKIKGMISY